MERIMRFDGNLDMFKNIVLLYKNDNGETFIGSSTNKENSINDNHIVLYKDSLPQDRDYLMGWNYLDDNSEKIYFVSEQQSEVSIDDFLAAHRIEKTWKDIDYTVVDSLTEINDILKKNALSDNEVRAYALLK